ncbi:MAG: hypothetical protein M3Y12_12115 [Bacteroidota bacterium]|nr:hypothetical protein [Bacteroidota bacterium]
MPVSSPLAAIYHVIQQVRATAMADASIFQKNEAATRAGLIDPILRALGWDTANVRMVEPERMVENKQSLDYVLKDADGGIGAIIEAKKLGESLDKLGHVGALIGYAYSLKPQSFFITDGINWHCFSPTHSQFQPVETLNIADTNSVEAALKLVRWLDAAQSGHGIQLTTPIAVASPLTSQLPKASPLKPISKPLPKKSKIEENEFIEVSRLNMENLPADQKPKKLRLPNGTVKPISTWKEILLEVCRLVLKTNQNLSIPFPDKAGKKTFLFTNQKPPKVSSTQEMYKAEPVFIYTNYDKHHCIANALYILTQLPSTEKSVPLAIRF